jgi:hypothetical protein
MLSHVGLQPTIHVALHILLGIIYYSTLTRTCRMRPLHVARLSPYDILQARPFIRASEAVSLDGPGQLGGT